MVLQTDVTLPGMVFVGDIELVRGAVRTFVGLRELIQIYANVAVALFVADAAARADVRVQLAAAPDSARSPGGRGAAGRRSRMRERGARPRSSRAQSTLSDVRHFTALPHTSRSPASTRVGQPREFAWKFLTPALPRI